MLEPLIAVACVAAFTLGGVISLLSLLAYADD